MGSFTDQTTGEARRGFRAIIEELEAQFPDPTAIEKEADKKDFAKLFGEYLRVENIRQNYDEFASLKALQGIDKSDEDGLESFKQEHYLSDDDLASLQSIKMPAEKKYRIIDPHITTYAIGGCVKKRLTIKNSSRLTGMMSSLRSICLNPKRSIWIISWS